MKRKTQDSSARNPSVVLLAFAPETEYELTLDGALLLEKLECAYITGGKPGLRDIILSILVMTDEDAVLDAVKKRGLEKLISQATAGKRPGDVLSLGAKVAEALEAAIAPADNGAETEKKAMRNRMVAWPDRSHRQRIRLAAAGNPQAPHGSGTLHPGGDPPTS